MKNEIIKIVGMTCNHCIMAVKRELSKLDILVKDVSIGKAEVEYDENKIDKSKIFKAVEDAGYQVIN